jgi:hypothetical protein
VATLAPVEGPGVPSDVLRSYKREASRLREVLEGPTEGLNLSFELRAGRDEPTTSSLTLGDRVHRHAALLRPFMAPESDIELTKVWRLLKGADGVDAPTRRRVERTVGQVDRLSTALKVNERVLTARDIYFAYGEGKYFADDPEAKALWDSFAVGPMAAFGEMLFHEACGSYTSLVFVILDVLLAWERTHPQADPDPEEVTKCIYCLRTDGDFGPEEHVIPESLIGDKAVLDKGVCADCNNRLSALDQTLLDFEPIAFLRAVYGPLTKKGKFPHATFREIDMEKIAPRAIRVTHKTGKRVGPPEPEEDGTIHFQVNVTGRHRFDPVPIARAFFKMGLGLLAHDAGHELALDPRYDGARAFILSGTPIETHLLIARNGKPHHSIHTWLHPTEAGTPVVLDIFGCVVAFDLEGGALPELSAGAEDDITTFWLGDPNSGPT